MGVSCAHTTDNGVQQINDKLKKSINSFIGKASGRISTRELTKEEVIAVVSQIMTDKKLTQETIMRTLESPEGINMLNDYLDKARIEKKEAKEALDKLFDSKVLGLNLNIATEDFDKNDPVNNPDILYIYADNLQASNEVFGEQIGETIQVKDGVTLNVKGSSAIIRTNNNGDINPNVVGIVTKKNAQNAKGRFIQSEGYFQDTDEDLKAFIEANERAIKRIKELITSSDGKYKGISIVKGFALDKASLPERFAEKLKELLRDELNIQTSLKKKDDGYGLIIIGKTAKATTSAEQKKIISEAKKRADSVLASLAAKRPEILQTQVEEKDLALLQRVYPNIERRIARINFLSEQFSNKLTQHINDKIDELLEKDDAFYTPEDYYMIEGLTKGTPEQQRIFAIKELKTKDGLPVVDAIIRDLKQTFQRFKQVNDMPESTEKQKLIDGLVGELLSDDNSIGQDFLEELLTRGIDPSTSQGNKNAKTAAVLRVRHLLVEYSKMADEDVFSSLLNEAFFEIEFNENIRLNYEFQPIKSIEQEEEDKNEEEKENANKEGYMLKYKLIDPSKTLTINIKKLLSSIYKTDPKSPILHVFTDLGTKVRMDALTAYRILIEEFSTMLGPEDFVKTLDNAISKYPWLADIRDKLVYNEEAPDQFDLDLRNEFYRCMRKAQVPYGIVNSNGVLQRVNRSNSGADILENIRKNYEGRNVLSSRSIYNNQGECDTTNAEFLDSLFRDRYGEGSGSKKTAEDKKKSRGNIKQKRPFGYALNRLRDAVANKGKIEDIIEAIQLLNSNSSGLTLEDLLRSIGVDTYGIDVNSLYSIIPLLEKEEIEALKNGIDLEGNRITIDQFMDQYIPKKQIQRLVNILTSISNIVYQDVDKSKRRTAEYRPGSHLIDTFQNNYIQIGTSLSLATEGYTLMMFRHNGKMRATYAAPDFISELVGNVKGERAEQWIEENYGQFDFFKNPKTKEWNNIWLRDFFIEQNKKYPFRQAFEYINILSLLGDNDDAQIQNIGKEQLIQGLIHAFYAANDIDGNKTAYYRGPLVSDVDVCIAFRGRRYSGDGYQDKILNNLVTLVLQEVSRIQDVTNNNADIEVENYNTGKKNGTKFLYIPELNKHKKEILDLCTKNSEETASQFVKRRDTGIKEILAPIIGERLAKFLNSLNEEDKIALVDRIDAINNNKGKEEKKDEQTVIDLSDESEQEVKKVDSAEVKKLKLMAADNYMTEFFYNDFFAQSQIQQLLGGDLAYYKNYQDFIKRNKQCYACGERLFAKETDEHGNIIGDLIERAIYLEDEETPSTTYESLVKMLNKNSVNLDKTTEGVLRFAAHQYRKITATDGQSFRTPQSFKKIYKAMGGMWTEDMEIALEHLEQGFLTTQDFFALWNPIKPFFYGHQALKISGRNEKIPTQHKNSEYMITALFDTLLTQLNNSDKLRAIHKFMNDNNIDVVHFHSVVKVGFHSPFDITYKKDEFNKDLESGKVKKIEGKTYDIKSYKDYINTLLDLLEKGVINQQTFNAYFDKYQFTGETQIYNELTRQYNAGQLRKDTMVQEFPLGSYMVVQPSADHLTDDEAIFGSQLKNIIMADLPADFTLTLNLSGESITLNREDAVKFYNTLLVDNMMDAFRKIGKNFSDIKELQSELFAKMKGNPQYGDDVKAALEINKDGTGFMLPFNSPNLSNKIEQLILSIFKNNIQRQKIKGGNAVLVSNFGLSDQLHVKYFEDDLSKGVEYIPALLPAFTKDFYKDFLTKGADGGVYIDIKKMQNNLGETEALELLDVIGYRIPTEDKYSIMPIRVVGFLPIQAGATIMLPSDIITMSGTDFDIDKLFLMIKEYTRYTHKPALKQAFENYCKEKNIDHKPLKDTKVGYREEYINLLLKNDEVFREFMEQSDDSFKLTKKITRKDGTEEEIYWPKYFVKRPVVKDANGNTLSFDEISKNSSKEVRDNILIDIIRGTLQNGEVSKLLMQPGNFTRVKLSSRQQKIMHNKDAFTAFYTIYKDRIAKVGLFEALHNPDPDKYKSEEDVIKVLEDFYDKYASPISPLDVLDYTNNLRNLMDGNALIGIFAVNSSNHYKLQFMPLDINVSNQFMINGVLVEKIDLQNSPFTGERIGRINAEYQAASPDNGKDPCLGDVGANIETAARIGFLARIGLSPEQVGLLNTIDDLGGITSYARGFYKDETKLPSLSSYNLDMNSLADIVYQFRTNPQQLIEQIKNDESLRFEVAMIGKFMENLEYVSNSLKAVSTVSRSDSVNGALPVDLPSAVQYYFKVADYMDKITDPKYPILGLDRLIDTELDVINMTPEQGREIFLNSPIPRLQAAYTLGIRSAITLCSLMFPTLSPLVLEGIQIFRDQTKWSYIGKKYLPVFRQIFSELTMAILSENSGFATNDKATILEKRNYYIHDFPMKFKELLDRKQSEGISEEDFAEEFTIKSLNIIRKLTNYTGKGIKFANIGKVSNIGRKHYREELESLLSSGDQEILDFAFDLFYYSYFDNGFNFGHNNFSVFYSTFYYKVMPEFIKALTTGNANIENRDFNITNFIMQFMLNHPRYIKFIKKTAYNKRNGLIIPKLDEENGPNFLSGINSDGSLLQFIRAENQIWKLTKKDGVICYEPIDSNLYGIPFYDMSKNFDEVEFGKLQPRGKIGRVPYNRSNTVNNIEGITFTTSSSKSYVDRTKENIALSDVTIALAEDFTTAGEQRTETEATKENKYIKLQLDDVITIDDLAEQIYEDIQSKGKTKDLKINIAGNGIYTLSKPQEYYNQLLEQILSALQQKGITISEIRSGGQTGIDEAGIIAAKRLGIKAIVHTTADFKFRDKNNKDISDEQAFKERFTRETIVAPLQKKIDWAITANNPYEVSTAGDKRFSALNATFQEGTIFEGQNVGGYTIEEVYQTFAKHGELSKNWRKYKGSAPSKGSLTYTDQDLTKEEYENYSYEKAYLPLWQLWADQNPELIQELREKSDGKTLTDKYANNTTVSQARALADILNSMYYTGETKKEPTDNNTGQPNIPEDNADLSSINTDNINNMEARDKEVIDSILDTDDENSEAIDRALGSTDDMDEYTWGQMQYALTYSENEQKQREYAQNSTDDSAIEPPDTNTINEPSELIDNYSPNPEDQNEFTCNTLDTPNE